MRETKIVANVVKIAIALSILSIVGCRSSLPPEASSPETAPPPKVPIQESEDSESNDALVAPHQDSVNQPESPLPTLPTTPIESAPSPKLPNPTPQNLNVHSTTDKEAVNVLTTGTFVSGEHGTQGNLLIVDDEGIPVIELGHDFQTTNKPDLVIVLHRAVDPLAETQPPTYRLKEEDYVEISPLKSHQGQQHYSIPAAIILDNYNSIAIWCRKSNTTFGAASFQW